MATDKVAYWLDIANEDLDVAVGEDNTRQILEQTKQMQQWILQECSAATKPSTLSANTSK